MESTNKEETKLLNDENNQDSNSKMRVVWKRRRRYTSIGPWESMARIK